MALPEKPTYIGKNVYITPSQITVLSAFDRGKNFTSFRFCENKKNLKDNRHAGEVSKKSQRKLENVVKWLLASAKTKFVFDKRSGKHFGFKVNFITLTTPDTNQAITEKDFKIKLLNPFLSYMRKYGYLRNYVWKLEFHKSGKIHCHLTTDVFIHWRNLRKTWNRILENNGFMKDFFEAHGHNNPNSTDVHSVYKVKNVAAYIAKYMSKTSTENNKISGRIWGCNYELTRALKTSILVYPNEEERNLRPLMKPEIDFKQLIRESGVLNQLTAYGEVYWLQPHQWKGLLHTDIGLAFKEQCFNIRSLMPDVPPEFMVIDDYKTEAEQIKVTYKQSKLELFV